MKNNLFKALFLGLAFSVQAQQSIVCDVAKLNSFPLTITATVDTDVTATILQNGVETPLAGYTGLFYFGDGLGGITITNSATGYNTYSWTIPAESTPTNGVYSVQILSAKDGRVKELGRGRMTVRANPSTDYIPVQWQTNNMTYMTAALARDIAIQANAMASNALVIANQALGNNSIGTNDVLSLSGGLVDAHNTNTASHLDIRQTASNGLANANEALARENVTTNAVNDLAGALVSNHNASDVAHSDIRASVSNVFDMALGAVKTNSVGGIAIGPGSIANGEFSISYGQDTTTSGSTSQAFGYHTTSSGVNSFSGGYFSEASGYASFTFGDHCSTMGEMSFAIGNHSMALHEYSFVWSGYNGISSHGFGTFNIDPVNGPSGFYIGETNLQTFLDARLSVYEFASSNAVTQASIDAKPSAESVTNAVFYKQIANSASSVTSTVSVVPSVGIYRVVSTSAVTTVVFDKSALSATSNSVATWETWVDFQYTNSALTLVLSGVTAVSPIDITCFGLYKFAMTYDGVTVECVQKYPTYVPYLKPVAFWFALGAATNASVAVVNGAPDVLSIGRVLMKGNIGTNNYAITTPANSKVSQATETSILDFTVDTNTKVLTFCDKFTLADCFYNQYSNTGLTWNLRKTGTTNTTTPLWTAYTRPANELEIRAYSLGWRPFN